MATSPMQEPAGERPFVRRKYIIDPAFQWKYVGWAVFGVFFVSFVTSTIQYGVLLQNERSRTVFPIGSTTWSTTSVIVLSTLAFTTVMAIALAVWGIVVTHRLCGPVYVMDGILNAMAAGRFPKRRPLRKRDGFKELYESLWKAVDAVRAGKRAEAASLANVLAMVRSASDADADGRKLDLAAIAAILDTLRADAARASGDDATTDSQPAPVGAPLAKTHGSTV